MRTVMLRYKKNGRRRLGKPLKRLLDEVETDLSRHNVWRMVKTALFWGVMQGVLIPYRLFGATYLSYRQGPCTIAVGTNSLPETSVRNYHYSLCNSTQERSWHSLRGGSLKSPIVTDDDDYDYDDGDDDDDGGKFFREWFFFRFSCKSLHRINQVFHSPSKKELEGSGHFLECPLINITKNKLKLLVTLQ